MTLMFEPQNCVQCVPRRLGRWLWRKGQVRFPAASLAISSALNAVAGRLPHNAPSPEPRCAAPGKAWRSASHALLCRRRWRRAVSRHELDGGFDRNSRRGTFPGWHSQHVALEGLNLADVSCDDGLRGENWSRRGLVPHPCRASWSWQPVNTVAATPRPWRAPRQYGTQGSVTVSGCGVGFTVAVVA